MLFKKNKLFKLSLPELKIAYIILFLFCIIIPTHTYPHKQWIIVTTIQYPTKALDKLARLDDWQLLVVGDKKTPSDWHLDNCIYLSPDDQENLKYEICKFLPWNHYARKNIGYLYAIEHGARIIYETDDDNYIVDASIKRFQNEKVATLESTNPVVNVYSYFGKPTIWPRGYPLSYITKSHEFTVNHQNNHKKIVIEQGLVNKEPDIDAIFRLSRYEHKNIYFDTDRMACILQDNVFCPFNSQNTLFYEEAFWALYIPTYVPFRACDIWRAYIAQRLLWETDYTMCFTPPTAIQERNTHDLMKDFEDEQDLYLKTEKLLHFLSNWHPKNKNSYILKKYKELYRALIVNRHFDTKEEALLEAWIHDLINLSNALWL